MIESQVFLKLIHSKINLLSVLCTIYSYMYFLCIISLVYNNSNFTSLCGITIINILSENKPIIFTREAWNHIEITWEAADNLLTLS